MRHVGSFLISVLLAGCAAKPVEYLVFADVAIKAAQKAKADSLASTTYRQAENNYLRAKKDYVDGYYASSQQFANDARRLAEQAEFQSIAKQNRLGGASDSKDGALSEPSADGDWPLPPPNSGVSSP